MKLLIRVDDRLLHGSVLFGWLPALQPDELWLADDRVARDEREAALYQEQVAHAPGGGVATVAQVAGDLAGRSSEMLTIFVVVRDLAGLERLLRSKLEPEEVMLASIAEKKLQAGHKLELEQDQARLLQQLLERGVPLTLRSQPSQEALPLETTHLESGT